MRRPKPPVEFTQKPGRAAYKATETIQRELERVGSQTVTLRGGRYAAEVACGGSGYFEAWTENTPFVYGKPASTLQGALDSLEERYRAQVEAKQPSADSDATPRA